jgi:hypothetical protein
MQPAITLLHTCVAEGWIRELCGYIASALVLTTFSMRSMGRLRLAAIASNLAFIVYSLAADLHPILALHCILLPLNIFRLYQSRAGIQHSATGARCGGADNGRAPEETKLPAIRHRSSLLSLFAKLGCARLVRGKWWSVTRA